MKELDPNSVIVEFVKQSATPLLKGLSRLASDTSDKFQVMLNTCFTKYITRSYDRYSKIKTLLYRDAPVSLKDFYVRTDLSRDFGEDVKEDDFLNHLVENRRVVISGTAGSGKSTFCKSVLIELIEKPNGIFPIFIELRHLNTGTDAGLLDYVLDNLTSIEPRFTRAQLNYALQQGKILLIFDGFDEINNEHKERLERELLTISSNYHNILLLVSSRPDPRFSSWEEFYEYDVKPLDKEKSKSLINKLEYDKKVKRKFLEELDQRLYEKHTSFASNPLLLTMMLLTYEQIAEIPNKMHLFYEQAFLTLFNKHDSLKSLYKRKSHSNLPLDEFKKLLSAFSIVSYVDKKYYFSESDIIKCLDNALKISGINVDRDLFLQDLLETVCVIQKDGNGYTFTHRSFQEYFTSVFLVNYASGDKIRILDKVAFTNLHDDVMLMAMDINEDFIEQEWMIPRLESLIAELSMIPDNKKGRIKLLSTLYEALTTYYVEEDDDAGIAFRVSQSSASHTRFLRIIYNLYTDELMKYQQEYMFKYKLESSVSAKKKLISIITTMPKDIYGENVILFDEIQSLDPEIIDLIYSSNCYEHIDAKINFCKEKLTQLKNKYSKKQSELSDLLFGLG